MSVGAVRQRASASVLSAGGGDTRVVFPPTVGDGTGLVSPLAVGDGTRSVSRPAGGGGTESVSPPPVGGGTRVVSPPGVRGGGGSSLEALDRRQIVAATIDVVATLGYDTAKTADIVTAAKVARRTFWRSFADKAAAVTGAYAEITADLREAVQEAYDAEPDPVQRVVAVLTAMAAFLADDPVRAEVLLIQATCAGRAVTEIRTESMRRLARLLSEAFTEITASSGVTVDRSPVVLESLSGGLYEVAYARTFRGQAGTLPGLVPGLADCVLASYRTAV